MPACSCRLVSGLSALKNKRKANTRRQTLPNLHKNVTIANSYCTRKISIFLFLHSPPQRRDQAEYCQMRMRISFFIWRGSRAPAYNTTPKPPATLRYASSQQFCFCFLVAAADSRASRTAQTAAMRSRLRLFLAATNALYLEEAGPMQSHIEHVQLNHMLQLQTQHAWLVAYACTRAHNWRACHTYA